MSGIPLPAVLGQLTLGLVNGSFYALLSLGLAVIFGLLGVVNFAHGAFYMLGAFAAYIGLQSFGLNYWWALLLAPLCVAVLGVIVERLLLLARVEQLQIPEDARDVSLAELVSNALRDRATRLGARGLSVEFNSKASGDIRGDAFLLQQALDNLIDNAIDFSPQGGNIAISITESADKCQVAVRDRGPGAPEYALPHLFERFYSLPRPATGQKSTGLGLAFVREVAKIHGGTVTFENAPDGGAIVQITVSRRSSG